MKNRNVDPILTGEWEAYLKHECPRCGKSPCACMATVITETGTYFENAEIKHLTAERDSAIRKLKVAEDIQHAEKKILIEEIAAHTETKECLRQAIKIIKRIVPFGGHEFYVGVIKFQRWLKALGEK